MRIHKISFSDTCIFMLLAYSSLKGVAVAQGVERWG